MTMYVYGIFLIFFFRNYQRIF